MKSIMQRIGNAGCCWLQRMVRRHRAEKRQRAIARIRQHFEWWGCDTRELTDADIEAGISEGCARLRSCGLTVQECLDGIGRIQAAMRAMPPNVKISGAKNADKP